MLCKYYQRGSCRFGDACRFSHSDPNSQGDSFQHRNYSQQSYQRFPNPSNHPNSNYYNRQNYSSNSYTHNQQNYHNYQQPNNYNYQQKNYNVNYQTKNYNSYQNYQRPSYNNQNYQRPSYNNQNYQRPSYNNQNYQEKEFNRYQYNKNRQEDSKDNFISLIEEDNSLKLWPLSSYAFIGGAKSFEGLEEHSAEEIRLLHLEAVHNNTLPQYLATVEQMIKHNSNLKAEILKPQNRSFLSSFINTSLKEICQREEEVTRHFHSPPHQSNSPNIFANNANKSYSPINNIFASDNKNNFFASNHNNIFANNNNNNNNIFANNNNNVFASNNNNNIFASNNNNNILANTNSTNIFSDKTQTATNNIFTTNTQSNLLPGQPPIIFGGSNHPSTFFNSSSPQTTNNNLFDSKVNNATNIFNNGNMLPKNEGSNGLYVYSDQMELDDDFMKEFQSENFSYIPSIPPPSNLI